MIPRTLLPHTYSFAFYYERLRSMLLSIIERVCTVVSIYLQVNTCDSYTLREPVSPTKLYHLSKIHSSTLIGVLLLASFLSLSAISSGKGFLPHTRRLHKSQPNPHHKLRKEKKEKYIRALISMISGIVQLRPELRNINNNLIMRPRFRRPEFTKQPHSPALHTRHPMLVINRAGLFIFLITGPGPDGPFVFFFTDIDKPSLAERVLHHIDCF